MVTTLPKSSINEVPRWEICNQTPFIGPSGQPTLFATCRHVKPVGLMQQFATQYNIYHFDTDTFIFKQDGPGGTTGSYNSGICAATWSTGSSYGVSFLTATGGTTTSIVTNQTLVRDIRGYKIHILSGPNAGATLTITDHTTGANSTIYVDAQASAFTSSNTYRLLTPRFFILWMGGNPTGAFRQYDYATDTITNALSVTNGPTSASAHAFLVSTPSWLDSDYLAFATGTATSATATTLVNSAKTWTTNQWANSQVRIVSGTGAGQIRTISSNTSTTLTVPTWTTTPDSTSVYSIEGNDDYIYYTGNGGNSLLRYSISSNTWTALTVRPASAGFGCHAYWPHKVTDSGWNSESSIKNGRYIYSARGAAAFTDVYDIALGTWSSIAMPTYPSNPLTYKMIYPGGDYMYMIDDYYNYSHYRIHIPTFSLSNNGFPHIPMPSQSVYIGNGGTYGCAAPFVDGSTTITYVYYQSQNTGQMFRIPIY